MKISIITTTLNSEATLADTIASLENQKQVTIEYIVIDGGSSDGTLSIIERSDFVTVFESQEGLSIYEGLNRGLKLATGNIVGFLHSDDLLASNTSLLEIVQAFESKGVDGVYGDLIFVNKHNIQQVIRNWKSCIFYPSLLPKGWMPPHPTLFLKREVYIKHGMFDTSYRIASDYDYVLRVFQDSSLNFFYLSKIIIIMRIGGTATRNLRKVFIKSNEDLKIIKHHKIGGFNTLLSKNISKIHQLFPAK